MTALLLDLWAWIEGATELPEGRKGAVLVVVWGGLAGRGQISKARLLGHGTHPQSPPVLRQGEEMRRERVFDFLSRFLRNFPGRNFLYFGTENTWGIVRWRTWLGRRCILKLDQKSKVKMVASTARVYLRREVPDR